MIYCSAVPQIANGRVLSASNVSFGGVARYECFAGFRFESGQRAEEVRCTEDGWTEAPKCSAELCPALPGFQNGQRTLKFGDGAGFGTVQEFHCTPGYRLVGSPTILCKADGNWSAEQPSCTSECRHVLVLVF